jgi:hypothetical protein
MGDELERNPLEAEIMAEKAAAYFTTAKKMEGALLALRSFDQSAPPSQSLSESAKQVREQLVLEAAERAWFFVIQREALGLAFYEDLFAEYGIPDEIRKRMGAKPSSV